jgi:hypothetical protein
MKAMLKNRLAAAALLLLFAAPALSAQTPQTQPTPQPTPQATPQPTPAAVKDEAKKDEKKKEDKKSPDAKKRYKELLEKAKKGEAVDFREMRLMFFETPEYSPLTGMLDNRALSAHLGQGDYAGAIKTAEAVLEKNFVDLNAHMVAYIAHRETKNEEKAKYHRAIAEGLLDSIKATGDGKSPETAYEVISISEEYAMFRALGVRAVKQSLVQDKGHSYDAVVVVDPRTNQQTTYYFNVDKPFSAYGRK